MKRLSFYTTDHSRYLLAIVAGLIWACAFPKLNLPGFAWIAPGLILAAAMGARDKTFRLGYVAGLTSYLICFYWLLLIPVNVAPFFGWLALGAYLALHPALWVWVCWKLYPARLDEAADLNEICDRFLEVRWSRRTLWTLTCAALWVTWEMIQARLWSGFPWNLLASSQYQAIPLIQISSITGLYGVSFVVAWFSVSLLGAVVVLGRRPAQRRLMLGEVALPALLVAAVVAFGVRQTSRVPHPRAQALLALVQPSIPQRWIWDAAESSNRFQQLLQLSERALVAQPDILVWPEAAVPGLFRFDTNVFFPVQQLARTNQVWLILGADDVEFRGGSREDEANYDYFNSSFLITPTGRIAGIYHKRRLVIFGEYIPLGRTFPIIGRLTGMGSFTPGDKAVSFGLPDLRLKTSVLICFEDIFPHHTREYVSEDTDFLLNLTNNGWFGEGAAQWQHAAAAVFRAIENGLPLVRCANNGLTCWVDAQGRMHEVYFHGSSDIYKKGFKLARVPVLAGGRRRMTFYHEHGDWFGWSCVGLSAVVIGWNQFRRLRRWWLQKTVT